MSDLRVGIVGASPGKGWAHGAHLPVFGRVPGLRLAAVSTSRRESADKASRLYGVPGHHDFRELVSREDVDVVAVSVRVPLHAEIIKAALENDKHVFCEWPLARDAKEASELATLARAKPHLRTFVGLQGRFSPALVYLRDLVRAGELGELLGTTVTGSGLMWGRVTIEPYAFLYDGANASNPLAVSSVHSLDSVMSVVGRIERLHGVVTRRNPEILAADSGRTFGSTADDHVGIVGLLDNGALFSAYVRGGSSRAGDVRWELNGSDADIVVSTPTHAGDDADRSINAARLVIARGRGEEQTTSPVEVPEKYLGDFDTLPPLARNVGRMWAALARDIRDGTREAADFAHAVDLQSLVEIVRASNAGMTPVNWRSAAPTPAG